MAFCGLFAMPNNLIVHCISVHRFVELAYEKGGTTQLLKVWVWLVVLLRHRRRDVMVILVVIVVMLAVVVVMMTVVSAVIVATILSVVARVASTWRSSPATIVIIAWIVATASRVVRLAVVVVKRSVKNC